MALSGAERVRRYRERWRRDLVFEIRLRCHWRAVEKLVALEIAPADVAPGEPVTVDMGADWRPSWWSAWRAWRAKKSVTPLRSQPIEPATLPGTMAVSPDIDIADPPSLAEPAPARQAIEPRPDEKAPAVKSPLPPPPVEPAPLAG